MPSNSDPEKNLALLIEAEGSDSTVQKSIEAIILNYARRFWPSSCTWVGKKWPSGEKIPQMPSNLTHKPASISVGLLDQLPQELLPQIFQHLDIQSLCRLSQASLHIHQIITSMTPYHLVMKHMRMNLKAMADYKTLHRHSLKSLYAVFNTRECSSCHGPGILMDILTCKRACHRCLDLNPWLWSISIVMASKSFGLTTEQLSVEIPTLKHTAVSRRGVQQLVNVEAARDLGLKVHGTYDQMREAARSFFPRPPSDRDFERYDYFRVPQHRPLEYDIMNPWLVDYQTLDRWRLFTLSYIYLPYLRNEKSVEVSFRCGLTYSTPAAHRPHGLSKKSMRSRKVSSQIQQLRAEYLTDTYDKQRELYLDDFVEHVQSCKTCIKDLTLRWQIPTDWLSKKYPHWRYNQCEL